MDQINKNAEISRRIMALVNFGIPVRTAVDTVLGAGTYDRIVGEIYDAMRAKAGQEVAA